MTGRRKVVYISGTRADFGLMKSTLLAIAASPALELSVVATGMHLSQAHGATIDEIEQSGLSIGATVAVEDGTPTGALMARNIGRMIVGFADAFEQLAPDIVLVLGDRGEMLAATVAAAHLSIATVHIHGGERSGTIDEPVRHAISKLAHFHFVATATSGDRLVRMGENPKHIYVTGAPGLDGLVELANLEKPPLFAARRLEPARRLALLLFHPVLQEATDSGNQMLTILETLKQFDLQVLALRPNSDAGSGSIATQIERSAAGGDIHLVTHLPRAEFVSFLRHADVLIGNSSSGIIEAATFGIPVINIGSRQNLRERNRNIQDVPVERIAIAKAVTNALAAKKTDPRNIYGDGHAGERIVSLLASIDLGADSIVKTNAY